MNKPIFLDLNWSDANGYEYVSYLSCLVLAQFSMVFTL